jgi:murein L,D-transpeptidase YcbB/YkuD
MRIVLLAGAVCAAFAVCPAANARIWDNSQIDDLMAEAARAPSEGLAILASETSATARLEDLANLDARFEVPRDMAADVLFRRLASDYAQGAITPSAVDDNWMLEPTSAPNYAALDAALDAGASPSALLRNLLPLSLEYRAMRSELAQLMQAGVKDAEHVVRLRANMERWRWLPRTWPVRRVEVRIAEYRLDLLQENRAAVTHDIIVGAPRTPTHAFNAQIESVTLNPDWDPPDTIAYGELLPRFRRNPQAAAAEGFEAIDVAGQVVDAASVDWNARPFPYRIRQRPGAGNALGFIRFNLPNPFAIYLHDTPSRGLFDRTHRALSHGCVRVKDPVQLGEELFDDPAWNVAALQSAIDTGVMQDITLATPVPVYFLYLTATVRPDGSVLYLDDIYHRDDALVRALDHHPVAIAGEVRPGMCPS